MSPEREARAGGGAHAPGPAARGAGGVRAEPERTPLPSPTASATELDADTFPNGPFRTELAVTKVGWRYTPLLPPSFPLATTDIFIVSIILTFPQYHIGRIINNIAFSDWLFELLKCI